MTTPSAPRPPIFDSTKPGCMTIPPSGDCYTCPPGFVLYQPAPHMPPVCTQQVAYAPPQRAGGGLSDQGRAKLTVALTLGLVGGGIWWFMRRKR